MGPAKKVFARNCTVRRIDKISASRFLDENHYLKYCKATYHYGMFIDRTTGGNEESLPAGTLVAVGTFSNGRLFRDGHRSYEWIRYASLKDLRVMGGMGKVLESFVQEVHPGDVMTYVDAALSDGKAYVELGFTIEGEIRGEGYTNLKLRRLFPPQDE